MKLLNVAWVSFLLVSANIVFAQTADPYLAEDLPDVVFSQAIRDQAAALDHDAVKIYEFVYNEFEYQTYFGLLKGPEQTLNSRAGNEYDLSALLVSLLRVSGVPARFVRGTQRITAQQAMDWTGTEEALAAANYFILSRPFFLFVTVTSDDDPNSGAIEFINRLHVWVEAKVSLARYRGAKSTANAPTAWVPLDPSFKLSDWQHDVRVPIDDPTDPESFVFNKVGADGYYRSSHPEMPIEKFEDQVRNFLATTSNSELRGKSLDQIKLTGEIRKQTAGVLPTSLPYGITEPSTDPMGARRDARLLHLHDETHFGQGFKNLFFVPGVGDFRNDVLLGEKDYRHLWVVSVCKSGVSNCLDLPETDPDRLLSWSGWSADLVGSRVTLTFPAVSGVVGPNGYSDCTAGIVTRPTIWVDGQMEVIPNTKDVDLCDAATLELTRFEPHDVSNERRIRRVRNIVIGGMYSPVFSSFTSSRDLTFRAAEGLLSSSLQYPIAEDANAPFVDDQPVNGIKDPGELYLGQHFVAQEALIGGLLNLAKIRYEELESDGRRRVREIHHEKGSYRGMVGTTEAGLDVDFVLDQPLVVRPSNLLIDLLSVNAFGLDPQTGTLPNSPHGLDLASTQGAAAEHVVWEEIVAHPAISTVSGFQRVMDSGTTDLIRVTNSSEADSATSSCNGTTCSDLDFTSYCLIKDAFGPLGNWKASGFDPFCGQIAGPSAKFGNTFVADELIVLDQSGFTFLDFNGHVYEVAGSQSGTLIRAHVIVNGGISSGGGYVAGACDAAPFLTSRIGDFGQCFEGALYWEGTFPAPPTERDLKEDNTADPVAIFSGGFFANYIDLSIAGRGGFDFTLVRSYGSQLDYDGPLGFGWIHTFDQHLRPFAGDPNDPNDDRTLWVDQTGSETSFFDDGAGGFSTHPWVYHSLVKNPDNSFTLTTKTGMTYQFYPFVGERASLDFIQDRNGNRITCVYDGGGRLDAVLETAGRQIDFRYDAQGHLESVADWTGREVRYTVDSQGDLVEFLDAVQVEREADPNQTGGPWVFEYYSGFQNPALNHNLKLWTKPEDRDGDGVGDVSMEFVYYDSDRVFRHTNSLGETTTFDYNYFRQRTAVTHPDGTVEQHFFDLYGNITKQVSARGIIRDYDYDELARDRIAERDGFGFETQAEYDARGNMIRRVDRLGEEETWTYNSFSQPVSHTMRSGRQEEWSYDPNGNVTQYRAGQPFALAPIVENEFDEFGNRVLQRRFTGLPAVAPEVTVWEPDSTGTSIAWVKDPIGSETIFELDALSRVTKRIRERTVEDRNGRQQIVERLEYDALNRVVKTVDPAGTATSIDFDANRLVRSQKTIVPRGNDPPTIRIDAINAYDSFDRLEKTTNALSQSSQFSYDVRGRLVEATSPLGNSVSTRYDLDGNVISSTDPTGAVIQFEYDAEDRPVKTIDPLGRISSTDYDEEGRVVKQIGPANRLIQEVLDYDADGRPIRVGDAEGRAVLTSYDSLGRVEKITAPVGVNPGSVDFPFPDEQSTTQFRYDLQGRVLSRTRGFGLPDSRTERISYDAAGRAASFTDPLERVSRRYYDEVGNLTASINAAGESVTHQYDSRGLLTRRRASGSYEIDDEYGYDGLGRRVLARNLTSTQTFRYDELDRPTEVYDPKFGTARRIYDADGRVTQLVAPDGDLGGFPEGVVTTYQYDGRGLLTSIADQMAGTWEFEFDAAARMIERKDPGGYLRQIAYTEEGFIDRIDVSGPSGQIDFFAYSNYDDVGNPGAINTTEGVTSIDYDALSRVKTVTYPGTEGNESFEYDVFGNRTQHTDRSGLTQKYVVDAAGQLTQILDQLDQEIESFSHDAVGRRTEHRVSGAVSATYRYDSFSRLREVVQTQTSVTTSLYYDAQGARYKRTETGQATSLYFGEWVESRGGELIRLVHGGGLDNVLAEVTATSVRRLITDAANNVIHVAEASGTTFERRYEAFGNVRHEANPLPVERGFSGRPTEGTTGLLNLRARHYDPHTGRFLQVDPIGIQSEQFYSYAGHNPFVFADPLGLNRESIVTAAPPFGNAADLLTQIIRNAVVSGFLGTDDQLNGRFRFLEEAIERDGANQGVANFIREEGGPDATKIIFETLATGGAAAAGRSAARAGAARINPVLGKPRVGSAAKTDAQHAFPEEVDNFATDAVRFEIPTKAPGGQVVRQSELYQLEGSSNGQSGVFEWIVDQGKITHRRFIPGGKVTGAPNQSLGSGSR